jgi:ketosteroid isomerase-like protein
MRIVGAVMDGGDAIDLGLVAEDVEYVNPPGAMEPGTRRGHDGWRQVVSALFESWETLSFETVRVEEIGERVLILGRVRMRGRMSGAETGFNQGLVLMIRNGQVGRAEWYLDHESALAAAGLEEPA